MTEAEQILEEAGTIVLVDWPAADVPDALTRAGFAVIVKGGPEPDKYSARELRDGEVIVRPVSRAPERADLIYCYRPFDELPGIVDLARRLGAKVLWYQSGLDTGGTKDPRGCWVPDGKSREARQIVEAAGLTYVDDSYIVDVARGLTPSRRRSST